MRALWHMRLMGFLVGLALAVTSALAQDSADEIDYDAWASVATRAETAISAARASNQALESLRSEIVVWRERFLRGQDQNAARIETIKAQIAALGAPPGDGEAETDELATRRAELGAQLAEALAPVTTAVEAYSRADGLAGEIDGIIRERQTSALLRLGPTPLNPVYWPAAVGDLLGSIGAIASETREAWRSEANLRALRDQLPRTILLLLVAAVLLLRGRSILTGISDRFLPRSGGYAKHLTGFLLSLGQVVFPVLGLGLLVAALRATGLLGIRGTLVADLLPYLGFCVFGAYWLGQRLLPTDPEQHGPFHPLPEQGRTVRRWTTFLGFLVGIFALLNVLANYDDYSAATMAVLLFPVAVLAGIALFQLGRCLVAVARAADKDDEHNYATRWLGFLGRLVMGLGVVGTGLAAIGYLNAGLYLLLPTAITLALLAVLLLLNDVLRCVYALITGAEPGTAQAALIPTLLSFLMVLASLPVFALIWGARVATLTELWSQFREGYTLGGTRISPEIFLTFVFVFGALYIATRIVQGALRINVLPKTQIDPGGQTAIVSGIGYIGIFLAALMAITAAGINLSSLAIVAGALSLGIGFGLQNIVQNFVAGIILLIERPVAEGDWIQVGGYMGTVKKISVRSTLIETFDRTDVIVPNGDFISGAVLNWTRTDTIGRIKVPVGVAYGTDTRMVEKLLLGIAEAHPMVLANPGPSVVFQGFGADALDFEIRAILRDVNYGVSTKSDINHEIAKQFTEAGIEIPFAQRDIWLRNPEALQPSATPDRCPPSGERDLNPERRDREIDTGTGDGGDGT